MANLNNNIFRVSQKYDVKTEDGGTEELTVTTTYRIVNLLHFRNNVGIGKKLKQGFGEANADVVLNFCNEKFEGNTEKLKPIIMDEMTKIDFLNELYERYEPFVKTYGLRVVECDFRFKR